MSYVFMLEVKGAEYLKCNECLVKHISIICWGEGQPWGADTDPQLASCHHIVVTNRRDIANRPGQRGEVVSAKHSCF